MRKIVTATNLTFPRLFEPGYIGKVWVKNRLMKSAMSSGLGAIDGAVSSRSINYYRELARGGAGVVIVEHAYVDDKASKATKCQLGASKRDAVPGLTWLASVIKENGARACAQLNHCGRQRFLRIPPIKAPSRIPWEELDAEGVPPPEELTFEEIREIVEAFGDAAFRVKSAEFDMVEMHAAHGWLLGEFLSPRTNHRTDWYGGNLKNRMRILLEIIANVRKKVGPDFPVLVRLSGSEYEEDGIEIEETREVAKALEKAGVNALDISGGNHHTMDKQVVPMYWPLAYQAWAAAEIKKVVDIPVIVSGSITSPELAEKLVREGKGDFVGLGRPLVADPYFPLKAEEGRPEDIAPCIRCCDGCLERGSYGGYMRCSVNVAMGREEEFKITPAAKPRKVAVVGGGPAGMEAASVAALRGHDVTLFEKRKLGGMLIEASVPDFKADLRPLVNYLSVRLKKTGVNTVLKEATAQAIKDGKFEVVIVATGSIPWTPEIPGLDQPFVLGALGVLRGAETGNSVVVVGGGLIASDVALFLAEQGKKVTMTTRGDRIAHGIDSVGRVAFLERLSKQQVEMKTGVHLEEIKLGSIIIADSSGNRTEVKADTVVLAAGLKPNRQLVDELAKEPGLEIFTVGDCDEPRKIFDAIQEGHVVAVQI